jgi:hypothetical protein
MKRFVDVAAIAAMTCAAMLAFTPALAQDPAAKAPATAAKASTPAAIALAKEILSAKHVSTIYDEAIPGLVQRVKNALLQSNLNYQKDLNEVAIKIAKELNGREKEIGDEMAKIYAGEFTEAELKELAAFYRSPVGKKSIEQEPKAFNASRQFMDVWAQKVAEEINSKFRAEMRARGKEI